MSYSQNPVSFTQVKSILDKLVKGREENLTFVHGQLFGWADKETLANAVVRPFGIDPAFRLIDPALVGVGQADQTNLYKALTVGIGGYERMPFGGPYATNDELAIITAWIDAGMTD
jgi:hypothetical protein